MTAPIAPAEPTAPAAPVNAIQAAADAARARMTPEPVSTASLETPPPESLEPVEVDPNAPIPEGEQPPEVPEVPLDTVELPGRRPGDPDLAIEVDDPIVANRLREMMNSYERKTESEARFESANQMMAQVQEREAMMTVDPMGWAESTLDPSRQMHLALRIFSKHTDALMPVMQAIVSDPSKLSEMSATLEAESYRLKEAAQQEIAQTRQATRNAGDIVRGVEALIPANLNGAQREQWRRDALAEVQATVARQNLQMLHPYDLPLVLANRLRAYQVDPQMASAALTQTFTRQPSSAPSQPRPSVEPNGEQLRKAANARRAASAAAPTGAGAPTAQLPKPPAGAGIREAANHLRALKGLRPK